MKLSAKDVALSLQGVEYNSISPEIIKEAAVNGIVIVYGASDDLMEFRGAINDEAGVYDGGVEYLDKKGIIQNECDDEDCPYYQRLLQKATAVEAIWHPEGNPCWTYKTPYSLPHEPFEMMEDGEVYCIGIVFELNDLVDEVRT